MQTAVATPKAAQETAAQPGIDFRSVELEEMALYWERERGKEIEIVTNGVPVALVTDDPVVLDLLELQRELCDEDEVQIVLNMLTVQAFIRHGRIRPIS